MDPWGPAHGAQKPILKETYQILKETYPILEETYQILARKIWAKHRAKNMGRGTRAGTL